MKFDAEPSPDYIEHVSKVHSDINKLLPSNILKLDDGDRNMDDIMLDSAEVKGLQSIDVSQSRNDFKSCNLPDNINNYKNERGRRNSPRLGATSEIDLIAQEDLFYMDRAAATDVKSICIDEDVQAVENLDIHSVKDSSVLINETLERENSQDSKPSLTTESLRSLGEILQRNNDDREIAGPSNEYHAEQDYSGSLIDDRRRLDSTERIACTPPSEETIELRPRNFEEFKADSGSTAENQDLRQKSYQVSEKEKDSTSIISKRLFGEDVAASISDLEAEGTSIVGNKNKVLNYQLSFQTQNDDVGTEEVMGGDDGTISARTSFARPVPGDSDLSGPSHLHGAIATSTQIPYSGNTSFHSESSTTSTRSFAFPKLQAEWNSSPVRMAKAKRRRLRKLHEWKSKLLCCKF